MEELDGLGASVFGEQAMGVARDQSWTTALGLVGEQDGGFLVTEFGDGDLAEGARVPRQRDAFVEDLGSSEGAGR